MIVERITDGPIKLQAQLYYVLDYTPRLLQDLKSTLDECAPHDQACAWLRAACQPLRELVKPSHFRTDIVGGTPDFRALKQAFQKAEEELCLSAAVSFDAVAPVGSASARLG